MSFLSGFLASYLTLRFLLVLLATFLASARGWGVVPFVVLAICELPKLYVHASLASLDQQAILRLGLLNGTVVLTQYAILAGMILSPRLDPRRSAAGLIVKGVLVGCAPWLLILALGGFDLKPGSTLHRWGTLVGFGRVSDARGATSLPARLVGHWEGAAVVDADELDQVFAAEKVSPDARLEAARLLKEMRLEIEYRADGSSTSTIVGAVVLREGRFRAAPHAHSSRETWKLIKQGAHSMQLESDQTGGVVALTLLGDDALMYQLVSGSPSAYVKGYRLERHREFWE